MKWTFDGHGINDENGTRICKVTSLEPYTDGNKRNAEFDRISNLIAAAPEMYTAVKNLAECMKNEADGFHPAWAEQINRILAKIEEGE